MDLGEWEHEAVGEEMKRNREFPRRPEAFVSSASTSHTALFLSFFHFLTIHYNLSDFIVNYSIKGVG
jgi:hypothetical protein